MDPSNNTSINTSHLHRTDNNLGDSYPAFLGGIHNFTAAADQTPGNDDIQEFFHPDLFDTQDATTTGEPQPQQQQQSYQSAFTQHASRQSQSPALPAYNPSPHGFTQPPHFTQSSFDPRTMYQGQQSYDPRFYQQQPSHSPSPAEQYTYQNPNFHPQTYHQQAMNLQQQQRQSVTPTPTYAQNQQAYSPFINFDSRNASQLQHQNSHMMQYNAYQDPNQKPSHNFVDPSLLNASQGNYANGHYPQLAQRPYQPSPYFAQPGSTVDPRSLQDQPALQSAQLSGVQPQHSQAQLGNIAQTKPEPVLRKKAPTDPNAPKRSRARPRKDGSLVKQGGQGTESETASDSDLSVEKEPEKTPALLSVQMPTDEKGKSMYQAVYAVWSPRNLSAPVEKIKSGIVLFGDTIRALRDSWKDKNESLKKAELPHSSTAAHATQLKADVAHYRQIVETVINRSLQHAHPAILKRLGDNQWTMSALYAFMLDRVTAGDLDSSLITSILKLAVSFETVDEEKLEATKWPKLLQRLTKKATSESKTLAQTVLSNATAATARKKAAGPTANATNGDLAAGVKRGRDGEAVSQLAAKKPLVKPSSKPLALQNAERRRAQEVAEAAKKTAKPTNGVVATGAATGQKAKVVITQPPKMASFSSLMSASKKPGTSLAERAAMGKEVVKAAPLAPASIAQQIKKEPVKRDSPPRNAAAAVDPTSTSSFKGFLSALEKKEEVKPMKVEEVRDETPEQRETRLRKESRKKLRVSWKSDTELLEIRTFTHDPDEEIGHSDSAMKDAGDTMKEGEMLKLHKGMDDLEDEDDQVEPDLAIEYTAPSAVDFDVIRDALEYNGPKFGGSKTPESASRDAQDKLETNTVMAVFASQDDRPGSPKEPPDESDDGDFQPCVDFGPVPPKVREKERKVYALASNPAGMSSSNGVNLAAQVQAMTPGQATQTGQLDFQQILGMLKPQAPPAPQAVPTGNYDLQKLVASVAQARQMTGQAQPQYQQQQQPQPSAASAPPAANLSSLLATFQQQAAAAQGGLPVGTSGNPNPYPGASVGPEKHTLDPADYSSQKSGKKKKGNNHSKSDSAVPANYKTRTCEFWLEGKCNKGDGCTYRHDRIAS